LEQVNVKITKDDLDWGETLKLVGQIKAFELLREGKDISAKFKLIQTSHKRGCRKCQKPKKGNFCDVCGSKISNKAIPIKEEKGHKWLTVGKRFNYETEEMVLYMDDVHPHNPGRRYNNCTLSLDYFMSIKYWYYRGY
jgi:hypothetical protein